MITQDIVIPKENGPNFIFLGKTSFIFENL